VIKLHDPKNLGGGAMNPIHGEDALTLSDAGILVLFLAERHDMALSSRLYLRVGSVRKGIVVRHVHPNHAD
jgi:hypothetical protein